MSHNLVSKLVKILFWTIMGLSVIIALSFFVKISGHETSDIQGGTVIATPYIMWAYILVGIAVALSILFPLVNLILNPKSAIKALVGVVGLGVVFLVGYLLADATPIVAASDNPNFLKTSVLLFADTGIFATYILFIGALVALVYINIKGLLSR